MGAAIIIVVSLAVGSRVLGVLGKMGAALAVLWQDHFMRCAPAEFDHFAYLVGMEDGWVRRAPEVVGTVAPRSSGTEVAG